MNKIEYNSMKMIIAKGVRVPHRNIFVTLIDIKYLVFENLTWLIVCHYYLDRIVEIIWIQFIFKLINYHYKNIIAVTPFLLGMRVILHYLRLFVFRETIKLLNSVIECQRVISVKKYSRNDTQKVWNEIDLLLSTII